MEVDEIRKRVVKFHQEEGVSYKYIASLLNINASTFYNFTSGERSLSKSNLINLDYYLKERGY